MRIMYSILNILFSNKANSQLYALTQVDIMEAMETDGEKWSDRTIYNKIKELRKKGFVSTGLRQSNSNTYYIIVILIIGSVATFIAINVLDMVVGVIVGICKKIHRHFYDKRLLKAFCEQKEDEV